MATDWNTVKNSAIQAAEGVIGGAWSTVSLGAISAVSSLVDAAKYIDDNANNMGAEERRFLLAQQKAATQNVLLMYKDISIAVVQNAIAAVITVIINAAPALAGFA